MSRQPSINVDKQWLEELFKRVIVADDDYANSHDLYPDSIVDLINHALKAKEFLKEKK